MNVIILCISIYILIGGLGMYAGNRKVDAATARARWIKFVAYVIIVVILMVSIQHQVFMELAFLIAAGGLYEIIRTVSLKNITSWFALSVYILVAIPFIVFSYSATSRFQFFIYFQVLTFDAFCQITGQLLGKSPMAPKISPAKTWEGLAGGIVFCIVTSMLLSGYMEISLSSAFYFGIFTAFMCFVGDIMASWYKRRAGIKDYSNFLPGQGGFLDRFDSLIMTAAIYVLLYLLNTGFLAEYFISE